MSALRIGNCSGFYGDRLSAMREMLEGAAKASLQPVSCEPSVTAEGEAVRSAASCCGALSWTC